jgi:hypothetical protein
MAQTSQQYFGNGRSGASDKRWVEQQEGLRDVSQLTFRDLESNPTVPGTLQRDGDDLLWKQDAESIALNIVEQLDTAETFTTKVLRPDGTGGVGWQAPATADPVVLYARKSADETVIDSDTLQDDNHLTLSLAASSVYQGRVCLWVQVTAISQDLRYAFTVPSGATGRRAAYRMDTSNNTGGAAVADLTTGVALDMAVTQTTTVLIDFFILTTNAGTLTLQWCCNNLTGTESITVLANSTMILTKVA